jgi:hypothetical protein
MFGKYSEGVLDACKYVLLVYKIRSAILTKKGVVQERDFLAG